MAGSTSVNDKLTDIVETRQLRSIIGYPQSQFGISSNYFHLKHVSVEMVVIFWALSQVAQNYFAELKKEKLLHRAVWWINFNYQRRDMYIIKGILKIGYLPVEAISQILKYSGFCIGIK